MDDHELVGHGRQLFDQGLETLTRDEVKARALLASALGHLRKLSYSADPMIRRNGHLGTVLSAVALNEATTANAHLNWLVCDGWNPTFPIIHAALEGVGATLLRARHIQEARLAAELALRVKPATPSAATIPPPMVSAPVLAAHQPRVPVAPPALSAAASIPIVHAAVRQQSPGASDGLPARCRRLGAGGGARRIPAVPGREVTAARRAVEALGRRVADGGPAEPDWVVRGRRIVWVDPLAEDDDTTETPGVAGIVGDALHRFAGRVHRAVGHAALTGMRPAADGGGRRALPESGSAR